MRIGHRGPALPDEVTGALHLGAGERVLAFGVDDNTGAYVVATTWALAAVRLAADQGPATARWPWHLVDAGVWQHETSTLSVTYVDRSRPSQWTFSAQRTLLPETVRERVQASVVLSTRLALGGRRTARVAIRADLATRELIPQVVLGRQTRTSDPEVAQEVERAMADLKDQVGLAP